MKVKLEISAELDIWQDQWISSEQEVGAD